MTRFGYTMLCEQSGPKELVRDVQIAEHAGFDFAVISDHDFPWVEAMGHSPYVWSVLGAPAEVTERIDLMTYATCPIKRYHPAVGTKGRERCDPLRRPVHTRAGSRREPERARRRRRVASGEPSPRDVGRSGRDHSPTVGRRLRQLLRQALSGDSAKIWDLPPRTPDLGIAVWLGFVHLPGHHADLMIVRVPKSELVQVFESAGGHGKPRSDRFLSPTTPIVTLPSHGEGAFRMVRGRMEGQL